VKKNIGLVELAPQIREARMLNTGKTEKSALFMKPRNVEFAEEYYGELPRKETK